MKAAPAAGARGYPQNNDGAAIDQSGEHRHANDLLGIALTLTIGSIPAASATELASSNYWEIQQQQRGG